MGRFVALALRLGIVGFGGGFAVAQQIKRSVVDDHRWMTEEAFVEHFAVSSALPGTTATNLFTILGMRFAGLRGATLAVVAFLTPSVLLMIAFGALYDHVRSIGVLASFLDGMSLATVGVVGAVAVDMRRSAVKSWIEAAIAVGSALALVFRVLHLLEVIAISGLIGALAMRPAASPPPPPPSVRDTFPPASSSLTHGIGAPLAFGAAVGSLALFTVFARIGIATFGGGFAMIPPIEHEVVGVRAWLTPSAFNDAVVLGQVTPGPVAVAATFIGYRVAGGLGAFAATLGIFGPPFVLTVIVARSVASFRSSLVVQGFLRGVAPAVVGVIAAATVALWRTTVHSVFGALITLAVFAFLARLPKFSPLVPLAAGGLLAVAARALQ